MRRKGSRAYSLLELVAVLAVVSLAAGLVLARVPHAGSLGLEHAARGLAQRLSASREQAILRGHAIEVRVAEQLPSTVQLESLDVGGVPAASGTLELAADGDALPARAVLADESGMRLHVLLPAGFHRAQVLQP